MDNVIKTLETELDNLLDGTCSNEAEHIIRRAAISEAGAAIKAIKDLKSSLAMLEELKG